MTEPMRQLRAAFVACLKRKGKLPPWQAWRRQLKLLPGCPGHLGCFRAKGSRTTRHHYLCPHLQKDLHPAAHAQGRPRAVGCC